jgi:hypothetical protein
MLRLRLSFAFAKLNPRSAMTEFPGSFQQTVKPLFRVELLRSAEALLNSEIMGQSRRR